MRALGIDPGTGNFDILCIEDDVDNVVLDETIPSSKVAERPAEVVEMVLSVKPDLVVGPSGYGLSFKKLSEIDEKDLALTTLERRSDYGAPVLSGVRSMLRMLRERRVNGYTLPGVVQLPTVPAHRKYNKIDMGTADKTCVTAYAVWDQSMVHGIRYDETSLICVEMGLGYNAAMAVENGKIVDGVGGTIFPGPGYLSIGLMDGELAYLLGGFSKKTLFEGGVSWIAAGTKVEVEKLAAGLNSDYADAFRCFVEGVGKAVAMLAAVMEKRPREVILTGRLSRVEPIREAVAAWLQRKLGLKTRRPTNVFAKRAKDVAMGAALIANGLGGGKYSELVETLEIRRAQGTVLDHVRLSGFEVERIISELRSD
ncbi:MAG: DUF1464 family protein [Candidatus Caldarchaeum sp.]|jgi:predicted butyrate kinase (DUF1464 family)